MEVKKLYEDNKDFREYVDRFVRKNPEYSVEEALQHKIIRGDIAKYYMEVEL